ncbi:hypothetical protein [Allonocardiopsis opalescens]|uniref:Transposase YdaD n=1 Tax=Allonocardiopsis opalescens TaxID=1144618 RepID=A0A2T0PXE9_9ACTN|nr:hypothetical protein [Allonocardiopsis opalescens]PRX96209.1 hypothetical protein CLV72_108215 [Allonocardiopsis opalescens]
MPTREHELLIDLFRDDPATAPKLLKGVFDLPIPEYTRTCLESTDLPEVNPVEFRADAVITLRNDAPVMAVIVEVQRGRDSVKRRSWPVYLTTLHARLRCPTVLLVVCPDAAVGRWCAQPIRVGHPEWVLHPLVVGPESVPVVHDPEQVRNAPGLALLSALAHGNDDRVVLDAVMDGLDAVDRDRARLYTQYILSQLSGAALEYLEAVLETEKFEYMSDFTRRYVEKGELKGEAKSVLRVLTSRGVAVSDAARARIESCRDEEQLDIWLDRVATVEHVDDLFR